MEMIVVYADSNKANVQGFFLTAAAATAFQATLGFVTDQAPAIVHAYDFLNIQTISLD